MTDPNLFIVVVTIIFLALGVIWTKKDYFNLLIKSIFWIIVAWGLLLINQIYY